MRKFQSLINHLLGKKLPRWGGLALVTLLALAVFGVTTVSTAAGDTTNSGQKKYHVVTIYDENAEKTIITTAETVKDALQDADISISKHDTVDPTPDQKFKEAIVIVNIRRARPITVTDGQRQVRVITAAQDKIAIAATAHIKLYPEDTTQIAPVSDLLSPGGAGLEMNVTRAKIIHLKLYGQEMTVRTQKTTIQQLLDEKKIKLGPDDGMDLTPDAKITDGLNLQIWRNGIQTVTATETIPFTTKIVKDPTRNVGYREIQTAGQNGQKTVIYQIEMRDGVEISRTTISQVVVAPAVEQVEIIGAKVNLPPGGHEDWLRIAGISPGDYGYVNFIFAHESGWRVDAMSRNGYAGLGQTRPANLSRACPNWQSDPICQIQYFDGYAQRYGGWAGAYNFWQGHRWW